jgi:hypothetical protein
MTPVRTCGRKDHPRSRRNRVSEPLDIKRAKQQFFVGHRVGRYWGLQS